MKPVQKRIFYFLLFLFFAPLSQAQDISELDAYIEAARLKYNIPGMAVGIVKDGKILLQKGYGLRESDKTAPVDENTLFAIASLTKAFTVTGLGMLAEEGKIGWNDKVTYHLPYFQLHDRYVSSVMTVEDLTCHRSGLATFDGDLLWYGTDYSRKEIVERIRELPLKQTFRRDFGYQNIMFISAGQLIEEVSGKSWDNFMKERIFNKLGMKNTVTTIRGFDVKTNLAYPHLAGKKISLLNYDNSGATAALNSNVSDMCEWIRFWLNDGVVNGDTLLSHSTINMILSPKTIMNTGRFDDSNGTHFKSYGMGWFLMDYRGLKVAHHGGGLPGYISKIAIAPEMNLGMVILTNDMSNLPTALMYHILEYFTIPGKKDRVEEFHEYYAGYQQRLDKQKEQRESERIPNTKPSQLIGNYAGSYTDKMYGTATVRLENGALRLILEPTRELFQGALVHWHYDTFEIQFNDPYLPAGLVTFYFSESGKVDGFKIHLPNPDFNFENLDFRKGKN